MDRTAHKFWTYADLKHTPDDGRRYEILDGELIVTPSPSIPHQRAVLELGVALHRWWKAVGVAEVLVSPVDVILSWTRVVIPDLVLVRRDRMHLVTHRAIEGAPDLVVEVLSPSTARRDRTRKLRLYRNVGIPEYWIVDPIAKTIEVLALGDGEYCLDGEYGIGDRLRSVTFDFELDVVEILR
jgi:Uma2 family endonuclease